MTEQADRQRRWRGGKEVDRQTGREADRQGGRQTEKHTYFFPARGNIVRPRTSAVLEAESSPAFSEANLTDNV